MPDQIDSDGYRANVAIVLCNDAGHVFWAGRAGRRGWQFPQGGILANEKPIDCMYRELEEEIGLKPQHVEVIGETEDWLRYRLPKRYQRSQSEPLCVGQKQRWYLLRMVGDEDAVCFDACDAPEFDRWCWVDYWYPLKKVIFFKRPVYRDALEQLGPMLFDDRLPPRDGCRRRSRVRRHAAIKKASAQRAARSR